jgi:hypothetical protein
VGDQPGHRALVRRAAGQHDGAGRRPPGRHRRRPGPGGARSARWRSRCRCSRTA